MKISEVEARVGISKANIRYYEAEGLIEPSYLQNGYRAYTSEDIETLKKVRFLRELGFGIDQIRACMKGTRSLSALAAERCQCLADESIRISRAREVCERLCKEKVSFTDLKPDAYKSSAVDEEEKESCFVKDDREAPVTPVLRLFARGMDMAMIAVSVNAVLQFGFRINLSKYAAPASIFFSLAIVLIMFLIEPMLLHFFGTTPGKAMLGLSLEGHEGELPDLESARTWTGGAILAGMGLNLPVIAPIRMFLSFRKAAKDEFLSWECLDYKRNNSQKQKRVGLTAFVLVSILLTGVQFAGAEYLCTPPNRGNITVEQFAENYNTLYREFLNSDTLTPLLNPNGEFEKIHTDGTVLDMTYVSSGNMKRQISYEMNGEYIAKVTVRIEGNDVFFYNYMDDCMQLLTITALLTPQGIGSSLTISKKMDAVITSLKAGSAYISDDLKIEAHVECTGDVRTNGTILQGTSNGTNAYMVEYTIALGTFLLS